MSGLAQPLLSRRILIWLLIALVFLAFIYGIRSVLLPFVVGILTAYFLDPAADKLERAGMHRGLATGLITVSFFTLIIALLVWLVPGIIRQTIGLVEALPGYVAALQARYGADIRTLLAQLNIRSAEGTLRNWLNEGGSSIASAAGGLALGLFASGAAIVNIVSLLLITPLVAFYLLRDWDVITHRIDGLLPRHHADTIRTQLKRIDETLAGFLRGQMMVCAILAVYYAVLLAAIGLQFGFVIGLFTGVMVILPYVGFLFGAGAAAIIGMIQFGFSTELALVAAVYAGGQIIESYFLTPKLVGESVGLHPLWIIFGMLAGGALFGFVGILLAVPVTAVVGVLIRFALEQYRESALYLGQ